MSADVVDLGTFTRQWAVEGRRIGWLLGAGASASAHVPTAGQIVLDLLARMYAAAHGVVLQSLNLGDRATREAILAYYDGMNGMPAAGTPAITARRSDWPFLMTASGVSTCAISARIGRPRMGSASSAPSSLKVSLTWC